MNVDGDYNGSVLRVFEARVIPGCAPQLSHNFATTSGDVVAGQPGNQSHFVGQRVTDDGEVLVFVSVWESLDAIRSRFGDEWENSHLPAGYEALIEECSVKHIALESDWHSLLQTRGSAPA